MSTSAPRIQVISMYSRSTVAIPDTMAEKRKTMAIIGVDHQGLALIEPKMKPTYPWRRKAEGMPMRVSTYPTRSSARSAASLTSSDPRVSTL